MVAGHGRLLAAQQLGFSEVPTISLEHLMPAQAKAFAIADNRLTEVAVWDKKLLGEQFLELSALDLDFSLDVPGFEIPEIDLVIEGVSARTEPEDEPAVPPAGPSVCRPGDLWQLGRHRILCGNALEEAAYQVLMGDDHAAAVFTDPPYNVPIDGHASGLGATHHREFPMASGEMDEAEFTAFLARAFRLLADFSRDGSLHYICIDWRHIRELLAATQPVYSECKNLCVWAKDNAGMGSLYRSQHELVFVFKNGRAKHRNNILLGKHGRNRSNLWSYPGIRSLSRASDEGNLLALHPTVKPIRLVADAVLDCTGREEIVVDPFLGSGTTVLAAERIGRACRGLELDPLYVDTAIRRWQAYTGDGALLVGTGSSFNERAQLSGGHHG